MSMLTNLNLNLFHLPHDHQKWIIWVSEAIFNNGSISPSPKVPTCHHENRSQLSSWSPESLLFRFLKIESLQSREDKMLVIWLDLTNLSQIRAAWTQSLSVWITVSSPFLHIDQVGETPTPYFFLRTLVRTRPWVAIHMKVWIRWGRIQAQICFQSPLTWLSFSSCKL